MGISKRVFHVSEGSSKVKLSAGTAARPSALPRNPIIPPIIAVTLSWPFLFPAVTHNLGISLIFYPKISDWIPTKHCPLSPPPHHWPWQEWASVLYLPCLLPHRPNKNGQKTTEHSAVTVQLDLGRPKWFRHDCRFSDGETCWLRPGARPIWAAAGAMWLSNMEKLQHDTGVQYKLKNVLGLVPSIVNE